MGATKQKPYFTVEQYLAIERKSEERQWYFDGEIYAMAGEGDAHGEITMNLSGILQPQLKGSPCRARSKDTKIRSGPKPAAERRTVGLFSYPDIVVICGEFEHHDEHKDVITNPSVIMEVLSPATEAFDRGEKFTRFQTWNPTLTDYVLVSQDKPQIEHYTRQPDSKWTYQLYTGLDAVVAIESIKCSLPLAEVYDRVSFPEE